MGSIHSWTPKRSAGWQVRHEDGQRAWRGVLASGEPKRKGRGARVWRSLPTGEWRFHLSITVCEDIEVLGGVPFDTSLNQPNPKSDDQHQAVWKCKLRDTLHVLCPQMWGHRLNGACVP